MTRTKQHVTFPLTADFPKCESVNASISVRSGTKSNGEREIQFVCSTDRPQDVPSDAVVEVRWSAGNSSSLPTTLGTWTLPVGNMPHILHEDDWVSKVKLPLDVS